MYIEVTVYFLFACVLSDKEVLAILNRWMYGCKHPIAIIQVDCRVIMEAACQCQWCQHCQRHAARVHAILRRLRYMTRHVTAADVPACGGQRRQCHTSAGMLECHSSYAVALLRMQVASSAHATNLVRRMLLWLPGTLCGWVCPYVSLLLQLARSDGVVCSGSGAVAYNNSNEQRVN